MDYRGDCIDCGKPFVLKEREVIFYQKQGYSMPKRCWNCRQIKKAEKEAAKHGGKDGVYGKCGTCGQPIYAHMKENKELFDDTGLCGACATGEVSTYINEL